MTTETFRVCLAGSSAFNAELSQVRIANKKYALEIFQTPLPELRTMVLSERPEIIVFEIDDSDWLRDAIADLRNRLGKRAYFVLAVTSPEQFVRAGSYFSGTESLEPSGLIDNLLIRPPIQIPRRLTLRAQFEDLLSYICDLFSHSGHKDFPLPSLYEPSWVPVMCDPESRNVWLRWLPRYSSYLNENPIIVGATGTGKTRLAEAIHKLSGREGPFVSITPRDFSSSELIQAELFGAVAGAYTGAIDKWGLVKLAEKGTLFIDELQSIDRDLQGKLITFIESKSYRRVGEAENSLADVRFVFATNRALQDLVDDGSLRDDFAYRLERLQIALSPLHTRRLDIPAAICFALGKVIRERKRSIRSPFARSSEALAGLTEEAYQILFTAKWPGNLRQLENSVAKLVELADIRGLKLIDADCTGRTMVSLLGQNEASAADVYEKAAISVALRARTEGFESISECVLNLTEVARFEALDHCAGNDEAAAELINDSKKAMELFAMARREYL